MGNVPVPYNGYTRSASSYGFHSQALKFAEVDGGDRR